jgi:hypothetical protein
LSKSLNKRLIYLLFWSMAFPFSDLQEVKS